MRKNKYKPKPKPAAPVAPLETFTEAELQAQLDAIRAKKMAIRNNYKERADASVQPVLDELIKLSADISKAKQLVYQYASELVKLKKEAFEVNGEQKSHTFSVLKIGGYVIGYREIEGWDDTVGAGVEKIHNFLSSLTTDESGQIDQKTGALIDLIFSLLRKDSKGNLRANAVVQLRKIEDRLRTPGFSNYNVDEYSDGVRIIANAYRPQQTSLFVEAWTVNKQGERKGIPLSIVAADFPPDYKFGGF